MLRRLRLDLEATSAELGHRVSFATWSRGARDFKWDQVPFVVVVEGPADRAIADERPARGAGAR